MHYRHRLLLVALKGIRLLVIIVHCFPKHANAYTNRTIYLYNYFFHPQENQVMTETQDPPDFRVRTEDADDQVNRETLVRKVFPQKV